MNMSIDSKKIARNTVFLYVRLILVMGVTFYSSRVILDKLGASDYGLYYVVYGVIGLLSFLNGTLSSGTSRFITFELGRGDKENLKATFHTVLYAHVLLSLIILIIGETIGLCYAMNILNIPPDRFRAAMIVYQISICSTIISIIQVPFTSEIIAHEDMNVYAYLGIFESLSKLIVVFLLIYTSFDKLIFFAILQLLVAALFFIIYVNYCRNHYDEVSQKGRHSKSILKEVLTFSGWNVIANLSNTLMVQGIILLYNLFFSPIVVAAQAISNQISQALMQFVDNVRKSIEPQVIKLYADEQYSESKKLTFLSAEYVFDLLMFLGIPCILIMPNLLDLWLVEVPEYTVAFARLIVLQNILGNFSAAFYTPMLAANKLSVNSISSFFLCVIQFLVLWILFKCGFGPLWARYLGLIACVMFSFIIKPFVLIHDIGYTIVEIYRCIFRCMLKMCIVSAVSVLLYVLFPQGNIFNTLVVAFSSGFSVIIISFLFMKKIHRDALLRIIENKLRWVRN